ncbi:astacin [Ostertagia ostertagi]
MEDSIEEINMRSGIADALYQGDIVLTKEQQEQIAADIGGARSRRQAFDDQGWPAKRWTEGVPYMFDIYSPITEEAKNAFKKAVKLWMDDTCINFTEYEMPRKMGMKTSLPKSGYLVVYEGSGCESNVGKVKDSGPQLLSLGEGCGTVGA